ncbi:P2X purinoceptor 4-like isoform X2 [Centruroides vittatus]|uniref:P2X purinoceptor 4-like isoform X2 n=1 Tax=Centruroides vittatus TaxID=120091 RepID=UPI00350F5F94
MAYEFIKSVLFEYSTVKFVNIKSKTVGILNRFIQLVILGYVIGYAIVYNKGYQSFGGLESSVTTKLKGVAFVNNSDDEFIPYVDPSLYKRIWDIPDIIVPPSDNGAFFVTTNIEITRQTLSTCPEDPSIKDAICNIHNNTCTAGHHFMIGNGVATGECVPIYNSTKANYTCQIEAWCPVEYDEKPLKDGAALFPDTENFTVLIKNSVDFPTFNIKRRNIRDTDKSDYLKSCHYHPKHDPHCPIFVLGDIIKFINQNETDKKVDYEAIAKDGGVVAIIINWDCNFDFNENECMPTYSFRRLDDPYVKISPGWNFRYAHYYSDTSRTLYKAYGIKFEILVGGRGGKFNIVPLLMNVGAGLGLFAVQGVLCDIVILYFMKKRDVYYNEKYMSLDEEEPITVIYPYYD